MSSNDLVSVIVPTFNMAEFLPRAINSVLNQTYTDLKLIVVDDGSKDTTDEVVAKFDDNRLKYLCHAENMGVSRARNSGIRHATGEYIAFLDADDEWKPQKLEKQLAHFQNTSSSFVGVTCLRRLNVTGEIVGPNSEKKITLSNLLCGNCRIGSSSIVFRKYIFDKVDGFREDFTSHEDLEFFGRILKHHKITVYPEVLVERYDTPSDLFATVTQSRPKLCEKFRIEINKMSLSDRLKILSHSHFQTARGNFYQRRYPNFLIDIFKSILFHPGLFCKRINNTFKRKFHRFRNNLTK